MKLCYGAVFRGTTPLCVFSPEPGNYEKIFIDICNKNGLENGKTSLKLDNCLWIIQHDDQDLNFLLVIQNVKDNETVDHFIDEIKSRFIRFHGNEWKTAQAHELYTRFEPNFRMICQMIESSSNENNRRQSEIFSQDPIESLSARNEYQSKFSQEASLLHKQIKRKFTCKRLFLLIIFILIIIYSIFAILCESFTFREKCGRDKL